MQTCQSKPTTLSPGNFLEKQSPSWTMQNLDQFWEFINYEWSTGQKWTNPTPLQWNAKCVRLKKIWGFSSHASLHYPKGSGQDCALNWRDSFKQIPWILTVVVLYY